MEPMMFPWSRQLILVLVFLESKECRLSRPVIMLYPNSECFGDCFWFMVAGTTLGFLRWFYTFSTKTCCLQFLNSCSPFIVLTQDKLYLKTGMYLFTICSSPAFLWSSEQSSSRMFTISPRLMIKQFRECSSRMDQELLPALNSLDCILPIVVWFQRAILSTNTFIGYFLKYTTSVRRIASSTIATFSSGSSREPLRLALFSSQQFWSLTFRWMLQVTTQIYG